MSDLVRAIARMFCVGFDGTRPGDALRSLIDRGVGGVVFFKRNVTDGPDSPAAFAELTAEIKRLAGRPILTCIDQEGGRVARLRDGFTPIPSMRDLGATGDLVLARKIGRVLGRELRAVNVDLDFAPVVDVDTNPANPVIADRSFGRCPRDVGAMGVALLSGLQEAGVAACAKHFPGHGDTSQDSHHHLPTLDHSMDRLESVELPPFRDAIAAGVASVMTAHVIFKPIDPLLPATMSRRVIDGLLRKRLGFDGLIVTDDLDMKAVADHFGVERAVVKAVNAGVDVLLICHESDAPARAMDAIVRAVGTGEIPAERIEESNRRISHMMKNFCRPPSESSALGLIGCPEHRAIAASVHATLANATDPTHYRS